MQNAESNLHNVFAISLQTLASKSPAFLEKIFNHNVFPASRVALMETNALPITATSRLELVFTRERTLESAPRLQFAPKMLIVWNMLQNLESPSQIIARLFTVTSTPDCVLSTPSLDAFHQLFANKNVNQLHANKKLSAHTTPLEMFNVSPTMFAMTITNALLILALQTDAKTLLLSLTNASFNAMINFAAPPMHTQLDIQRIARISFMFQNLPLARLFHLLIKPIVITCALTVLAVKLLQSPRNSISNARPQLSIKTKRSVLLLMSRTSQSVCATSTVLLQTLAKPQYVSMATLDILAK
jgi:hypothetical protein